MKKTLGVILNILFGTMLAAGVALILFRLCGYKILAVETGSMGKSYPVGSLIIAESCSPEDIREGDVISFVINEKLVTVTHRVVSVDSENRLFYTKGDQNNTADSSPTAFKNLIGKVKIRIPYLGYALIWAHTLWGKVVIALAFTLIAVCAAGGATYKNMKSGKGRKNEQSDRQKET